MMRSVIHSAPLAWLVLCLTIFSLHALAQGAASSDVSPTVEVESSSRSSSSKEAHLRNLQKVRALTHVASLNELRLEVLAEKKLATQRARCEAELAGPAVPASCFWVLKKEKDLRIIHATSEIRDASWLERLCISRAEKSHDLSALMQRQNQEETPSKCQAAIDSRAADLRYQYETTSPQRLFQEHDQAESPHDD